MQPLQSFDHPTGPVNHHRVLLRIAVRRPISLLAICGTVLLASCSAPDYTPVRDWAETASQAADYPPIVASCLSRDDGSPNPPLWLGDGTRAMQDALSIYLLALGTIAADGVLPYREDPFAQLASRTQLASEVGSRAVATLGGLLRRATRRNSRAPQLGDTIAETDGSVQALIAALLAAVESAATGIAAERDAVAIVYDQLEQETRDIAARRAIRDVGAMRDREYAAGAAARASYIMILRRIAEGHALLRNRTGYLTQEAVSRQIRAAEGQLRRSAALLPRAMASMPTGIACLGPQQLPGVTGLLPTASMLAPPPGSR